MRDLDLARNLHEVFGNRGLHSVGGDPTPIRVAPAPDGIIIVRDLATSRAILGCDAFESVNEFAPGYHRLARHGRPLPLIERFFQQGPLFQEGQAARDVRRSMLGLLKTHTRALEADEQRITALMLARRSRLRSPLEFATLLVGICMVRLLTRLLPIGPRQVLRALKVRRSVFYLYFHGSRHLATEEALRLISGNPTPEAATTAMTTELLIAQSLLTMAYDPLVASLCGWLIDDLDPKYPDPASRYCPVSFITRICVRNHTLGSLDFRDGDRCYLALAPTEDEPRPERFPFGAGPHVCVGRHLSLKIFAMAGRIAHAGGDWEFQRAPRVAPDGAFLAFSDEPAETGQPR